MHTFSKTLAAAGVLTAVTMAAALPARADNFGFSFNGGDVGIAYSNGYYDRGHRWHDWRDAREAREYRARFGYGYDYDYRPYNPPRYYRDGYYAPRRFDRDGDGVPNRYDARPRNPYRY